MAHVIFIAVGFNRRNYKTFPNWALAKLNGNEASFFFIAAGFNQRN
jgi:hypothetical protein